MIYTDTENSRYRASRDARSTLGRLNKRRLQQHFSSASSTFDEVVAYGAVLDFRNLDSEDHGIAQNSREQAARDLATENRAGDPYREREPLSEALWRTSMGDITFTERLALAAYAERYQNAVHVCDTRY